jgi:adenylate kinase
MEVLKMRKMIFIGGIHGVGKTSLCKSISQQFNIAYHSASHLITDMKNEVYSQNKLIENIERNQDLLSLAVDKLNAEKWFLLDGHFCLLNQDGQITHIPQDTFTRLAPRALIVLTDTIESISNRISVRDKVRFNNQLLHDFQAQETEHSESIAKHLNSSLLNINVNNTKDIFDFVENLISIEP